MRFRMMILLITMLLGLGPAFAQLQTKVDGANVRVGLSMATGKGFRACSGAEVSAAKTKIAEMTGKIVRSTDVIAKAKAKGSDPTRPDQFLSLNFMVACLENGTLGVKFPTNGKARAASFRRDGRTWVDQ